MMRTVFLLFLLAVCSINPAASQSPRVDRIEVTEFGIYDLKTVRKTTVSGTATGSYLVTEGKLTESTTTIPARPGISFGYSYRIIGTPANGQVKLKDVNIVPAPGLRNPRTGETIFREEVDVVKSVRGIHRSDYTLSETSLLPGTWTFQLWIGNRKMAEQTFLLVKP